MKFILTESFEDTSLYDYLFVRDNQEQQVVSILADRKLAYARRVNLEDGNFLNFVIKFGEQNFVQIVDFLLDSGNSSIPNRFDGDLVEYYDEITTLIRLEERAALTDAVTSYGVSHGDIERVGNRFPVFQQVQKPQKSSDVYDYIDKEEYTDDTLEESLALNEDKRLLHNFEELFTNSDRFDINVVAHKISSVKDKTVNFCVEFKGKDNPRERVYFGVQAIGTYYNRNTVSFGKTMILRIDGIPQFDNLTNRNLESLSEYIQYFFITRIKSAIYQYGISNGLFREDSTKFNPIWADDLFENKVDISYIDSEGSGEELE